VITTHVAGEDDQGIWAACCGWVLLDLADRS